MGRRISVLDMKMRALYAKYRYVTEKYIPSIRDVDLTKVSSESSTDMKEELRE